MDETISSLGNFWMNSLHFAWASLLRPMRRSATMW